jgi:hypothetical protein
MDEIHRFEREYFSEDEVSISSLVFVLLLGFVSALGIGYVVWLLLSLLFT